MERQEQVREKVAAFIGADRGRDRLRPQHLDGDEPGRRPAGRRGARALRRARVPDRHPALDPSRHERRVHARGGRGAAPGVVPGRPGAPRGHPLHQPRAVLERLPLRPRRLRRDQGGPQLRGLRQPERGGLPDRREEEPDRRLRDRRAQVAVRGLRGGLRLRAPGDPGQEAPARHRLDERRAPLRLRQPPDHDQEDLRPRRDGLSVFRPHLRPGRRDRLPERPGQGGRSRTRAGLEHVPHLAPAAARFRGALAGRRAPVGRDARGPPRPQGGVPRPGRAQRVRDREAGGPPRGHPLLQQRARHRRVRGGAHRVSEREVDASDS